MEHGRIEQVIAQNITDSDRPEWQDICDFDANGNQDVYHSHDPELIPVFISLIPIFFSYYYRPVL